MNNAFDTWEYDFYKKKIFILFNTIKWIYDFHLNSLPYSNEI